MVKEDFIQKIIATMKLLLCFNSKEIRTYQKDLKKLSVNDLKKADKQIEIGKKMQDKILDNIFKKEPELLNEILQHTIQSYGQ